MFYLRVNSREELGAIDRFFALKGDFQRRQLTKSWRSVADTAKNYEKYPAEARLT